MKKNSQGFIERKRRLLHAIQVFNKQYPDIIIRVKASDKSHDRFLFSENSSWNLGPSLKDAGKKATTINQLKDPDAEELKTFFNKTWETAEEINS